MRRYFEKLFAINIICCVPGCASLYDSRRDANTTAVAKAFDEASPGAYFDKLRESYREAAARDEASVLWLKRAERDSEALSAVAPVEIGKDERALIVGAVPEVGSAPFRLAITDQLGALTSGCQSSCPAPPAAVLIRWRAIAAQRVALVRFAADQADTPLRDFVGTSGTIGILLKNIVDDVAHQQADGQRAKMLEAEIDALDKKAAALPRAQFVADIAKLQKDLVALDLPAAAKVLGLAKVAAVIDDLLAVELKSAVDDAAADTATDAETKDPSKTTKRAQAVLELLGATEQLVLAYQTLPAADRASALLIAKAATQQQLDVAKLDAKLAADLLGIHRKQLNARSTELSHLADAALALRSVRGDSDRGAGGLSQSDRIWYTRALVQYGIATSNGRLVTDRLDRREAYLRMAYRIDLADRTASNRRALIAPAIAQIKAAGAVGIKPELIAGLAGQLGVTTSILAK